MIGEVSRAIVYCTLAQQLLIDCHRSDRAAPIAIEPPDELELIASSSMLALQSTCAVVVAKRSREVYDALAIELQP